MTDSTRPDDWNRVEYDWPGSRTMTDIVRDLQDDAEERRELKMWATANDDPFIDVECPICLTTVYPVELPGHVGSWACARLLLDNRIADLITERAAPVDA